jgi:CheY-like chemotaxis protein
MEARGTAAKKKIVVVDNDRDIAEIVQTILVDEGFAVSCLYVPSERELKTAIDRLEPDCVLLDGAHGAGYGLSWDIATWLASRDRPVPALMFTGHTADREEAMIGTSKRAQSARIAGVIPKPFDIDHLITTVRHAVGEGAPGPSNWAEDARHGELLERLRAAGAEDLRTSQIGREWATFRGGAEHRLYKIYRWRAVDVYFIGRYSEDGTQLDPIGQFYDFEALVLYSLDVIRERRHN